MFFFFFYSSIFLCVCSEVTVTSISPPSLCRIAYLEYNPSLSQLQAAFLKETEKGLEIPMCHFVHFAVIQYNPMFLP